MHPTLVGIALLMVLTVAGASPIQAAIEPSSSPSMGEAVWGAILGNALVLTVIFVILTAIIGALIRYRRKDRVLKDFDRYAVVVVLADGRRIWGRLQVYPNGLEIHYKEPVKDPSGHTERSFVLHQGEMAAIRAIIRPKEMLTPSMLRRRRREIVRYVRPSIGRRLSRFLILQFSILRDALVQTFTLIIGHARSISTPTSRVGTVLQSQDRHINEIGRTVITSVNLAYDPVLESFFGQGCVVEVPEGSGWREIPCVLKEYSPEWIGTLRAGWPMKLEVRLEADQKEAKVEGREIKLMRGEDGLILENGDVANVELMSLQAGSDGEVIDLGGREVLPGERLLLDMVGSPDGDLLMKLLFVQPGDLIVPRSSSVVRHRLRQEPLRMMENLGIRR